MTNSKQSTSAQPSNADQRKSTGAADQNRAKREAAGKDDLPGAEGPLSAGANEDTYD